MNGAQRPNPWDLIFSETFIYRDKCWETCGGGYCCKPQRVQRNFSIFRQSGVDIPLLPGEYQYLKAKGWLQDGFETHLKRHIIKLPEGQSFPIYQTACVLDGICSDHAHRPLVCRIYPFAPIPRVDGTLEGFEEVALIDLFWQDIKGATHPCTVAPMRPGEREHIEALCAALFQDPVNIFYLRAAHLFKKAIVDGVRQNHAALLQQGPDAFFKTWEQMMVFGLVYDQQALLAELQGLWHAMVAHHGPAFTLDGL